MKYFQEKYAMSAEGAENLRDAIIWTVLLNISFFTPLTLALILLRDYVRYSVHGGAEPGRSMLFYAVMSAVFFALMFVIAVFQYNSAYTKIYSESGRQRINLAEKLRKLPLAFFAKKDVSDLSSTIMEDVTQIETLFSHSVPQIYASFTVVGVVAVSSFFFNFRLAAAAFWVVPVALSAFFVSRNFQKKVHKETYLIKRDITEKIQEGLESAREIKSYNKEDDYTDELNEKLDGYEKYLIKTELLLGALINFAQAFLKLGMPSVLAVGAILLARGEMDVFTFILFLILSSKIYEPVLDSLSHFSAMLYLGVRIDRLKEMENLPIQTGSTEFTPKNYDIEFKDVEFSYGAEKDSESIKVIRGISFTAKQGEVTALVGPSGGGKTTVARLSARFWDYNAGSILLGGKDISKVDPETLLVNFSIVFQDVALFNSSVLENIRLGKKDASDAEVYEAARLAQCDEFVNRLPDGYNTLIGENGEKLSGGERQRLSIARAILKDAPIILLDEATASLDAENESKIQTALSELIKNKTVMIIAHRMRTVLNADKIVVLKDGLIAEMGSPEALNSKNGIFAAMLKAQMVA